MWRNIDHSSIFINKYSLVTLSLNLLTNKALFNYREFQSILSGRAENLLVNQIEVVFPGIWRSWASRQFDYTLNEFSNSRQCYWMVFSILEVLKQYPRSSGLPSPFWSFLYRLASPWFHLLGSRSWYYIV